jgi:hypothetical protein
MTITISRLYDNYSDAERAVTRLEGAGVPHSDISIVANNSDNWFGSSRGKVDRDRDGVDDRAEGAGTGAGIGAGLGGAAGLLAGLGLLAIPGLGPVVAAGWLASTAVGAAAGAATGGIVGALTEAGVSREDASRCLALCGRRSPRRHARVRQGARPRPRPPGCAARRKVRQPSGPQLRLAENRLDRLRRRKSAARAGRYPPRARALRQPAIGCTRPKRAQEKGPPTGALFGCGADRENYACSRQMARFPAGAASASASKALMPRCRRCGRAWPFRPGPPAP